MLLRPATPDDAMAVARVHVRSWQAGYRGLIADAVLDAMRPEDRAVAYTFGSTDPADPATIVAVDAEDICGLVTTRPGELLALYVDPDRWGTGVGRELVAAGRECLAEAGFAEARLWMLAGNARADRFYRIDGWTPDGTMQRAEIWGVEVDEVGYRRPLP